MAYEQQKSVSYSSGDWKFKVKVLAHSCSCADPPPAPSEVEDSGYFQGTHIEAFGSQFLVTRHRLTYLKVAFSLIY